MNEKKNRGNAFFFFKRTLNLVLRETINKIGAKLQKFQIPSSFSITEKNKTRKGKKNWELTPPPYFWRIGKYRAKKHTNRLKQCDLTCERENLSVKFLRISTSYNGLTFSEKESAKSEQNCKSYMPVHFFRELFSFITARLNLPV